MLDDQRDSWSIQKFLICYNWCLLREMHSDTSLMHELAQPGFCVQSISKVTLSAPAYCIGGVVLGLEQEVIL